MSSKNKKQLPVLEVHVDTAVINTVGLGASVLQMCESVGVRCVTQDQLAPNTVTWHLVHDLDSMSPRTEVTDEVLAIVPVNDLVVMVNSQLKAAEGKSNGHSLGLTEYVRQLHHIYPEQHLSVAVHGVDKYFSDQKRDVKRKHREEVTGQRAKIKQKAQSENGVAIKVTRFQVEEALVATQLETGCCCRLLDTNQEVAELVKCYTKAVLDKPSKKDRFDSVFSFLEEGSSGVRTDKTGAGLLKVWKLQLQQLHNLGSDVAAAIVAVFPSPLALKEAYAEYPNQNEAWKVTENIVVRRGAGALETARRVGQQLSRRIHDFMTSCDQDYVVK